VLDLLYVPPVYLRQRLVNVNQENGLLAGSGLQEVWIEAKVEDNHIR
jgi:hypothetical protein